MIQRVFLLFVKALDNENIKLLVWPTCIAMFSWGIYGTFFAAPPTVVLAMGRTAYNLWVWQNITGPPLVLLGVVYPNKNVGLWLQLGGYLTMFLVLSAYEVTGIYMSRWGEATYSLFFIAPYIVGSLLLATVCVRKLYLVRKTQKEIEGGILP